MREYIVATVEGKERNIWAEEFRREEREFTFLSEAGIVAVFPRDKVFGIWEEKSTRSLQKK